MAFSQKPKISLRSHWGLFATLLVTLLVYSPVRHFAALDYDDQTFVYDNPFVSSGLSLENLKWAVHSTQESNLWTPLTWVSHQLDVTLFGLAPGAHHIVSLCIHLGAVIFLWLLLGSLQLQTLGRIVATALFALHPHGAEVIGWVASRKELLVVMFMLASLWCWNLSLSSRSWKWYILALNFAIFALLSKPNAVVLPVLMLLIWAYGRLSHAHQTPFKNALVRVAPMVAASILVSVITVSLQHSGGLSEVSSMMPFEMRVRLIPYALWHYLQSILGAGEHRLFVVPPTASPSLYPLIALLGAGVLLLTLLIRKRLWVPLLGLSWFTVSIAPVLGLIPVSVYYVADRYVYFAQIGAFILVASAALFLLQILETRNPQKANRLRMLMAATCFASILAFVHTTYQQIQHWKNGVVLFSREARLAPQDFTANYQYARASLKSGNPAQAELSFKKCIELDPGSPAAIASLASIFSAEGRLSEAQNTYAELAQVTRSAEPLLFLLGGQTLLKANRAEEAAQVYQQGLHFHPQNTNLLNFCALTLGFRMNQPERAMEYLLRARSLSPDNKMTHDLGNKLLRKIGSADSAKMWLNQGTKTPN